MAQDTNSVAAPALQEASRRQRRDFTRPTPLGGATPRRRGADFYDTILWRLLPNQAEESRGFAVGMTSCGARAGVSTVAANVAIRAADHRTGPVLIVDANFPRPRLDRVFRAHDARGLGDVLAGSCELSDAVHPTSVPDLKVMPNGARGIVDRVSVDQQSVDTMLKELCDQFRVVVFDLPEADQLRHSLLIARRLDAVLMVLRSGAVRQRDGQHALAQLEQDGVNVIGAVMTQQKQQIPRWFQHWL